MNNNLMAYLKAGYVALIHAKEEVALQWVQQALDSPVRLNGESIEVNIGDTEDDFWVPSKYYYECDTLFKKG